MNLHGFTFPDFCISDILVSVLLRFLRFRNDRPDVPDAVQSPIHFTATHCYR